MQENKPEKKNEIIEKLIKHFDGYINNFKDRLKINSIFNVFENKIREDLNTLVKLSHDRYKSVKSGNTLNTMLEKQRPVYQELANNVLNEEFYKSSDLAIEKNKFKHFTNESQNKDIYALRNKIKGKQNEKANRSSTEDSLVLRARQRMMKKTHNQTQKTKNTESIIKTVKNVNRLFPIISAGNNANNTSKHNDNASPNNSMEKPIDSHHNSHHNHNKDYAKLIENDRKLFFTQIEDYKKQLEGLRSECNDDQDTVKVTKKIAINLENLNILNYKHNANLNVIEKKDDNDTIDIKKLIKMAKNGKKLPDKKLKNYKLRDEDVEELHKLKEKHEEGNTIEVVRNEIINSFNIEGIIANKKNVLKLILKDEEMPNIEDYEKMVKRNLTSEKLLSSTRVQQKPKEEANPKDSDKVKDEYKKNYENKQEQWKMEDIQQGNLEKLEKEKKKETKLFLNQIRKRPRFAQIFVDQYSLRDENVNKNIIEISKYLGRNLYGKKNLNSKIDKYLQELEKSNHIKDENSIEDEDSLNKEQKLIHRMMLRNLENEEQEDQIYEKLGINEKQEILNLVKAGRLEKTKEETLHEDFHMFQTFKHDVITKETMYKSQGKTQFKHQILNYTDYSANKINNAAAHTGGVGNVNKEYYENYRIEASNSKNEQKAAKLSDAKNGSNNEKNYNGSNNKENDYNYDDDRSNKNGKSKNINNANLEKFNNGEALESRSIGEPKTNNNNVLRSSTSSIVNEVISNNEKFSPKCTSEESNFCDVNFNSNRNFQESLLPPINLNSNKHSANSSIKTSSRKSNIGNNNLEDHNKEINNNDPAKEIIKRNKLDNKLMKKIKEDLDASFTSSENE